MVIVSKISIECFGPNEEKAPDSALTAVVLGCRQALDKLGALGGAIEAFKIMWVYENGELPLVPNIKIHFSDPMGNPCAHSFTLYNQHRTGVQVLSADYVADALCKDGWGGLGYFIGVHLQRCADKLAAAQIKLAGLTSTIPAAK